MKRMIAEVSFGVSYPDGVKAMPEMHRHTWRIQSIAMVRAGRDAELRRCTLMTIREAIMPHHREMIRDLFSEYLDWACARLYEDYRVVFDRDRMVAHDMETIDQFLAPNGFLLLAFEHDLPAGCACTRTIGQEVAEMKRMYVRPDFRRKGIGSKLVAETIRRVRQMGYAEMRLDSAGFMSAAHGVYRSAGFEEIEPYEESEIPREHWKHWVFMKLRLR